MGAEKTTRHAPEFGRSLRERRRAAGLSQARLATAVGVSAESVGSWERAELLPDLDELRAVASALGLAAPALDDWVAEVRTASAPPAAPPVSVVPVDLPADPFAPTGNGRGTPNGNGTARTAANGNGRGAADGNGGAKSNGNGGAPLRSAAWGALPSPVNGRSSNGRSNGRSNGAAPKDRSSAPSRRRAAAARSQPAPKPAPRRRTPRPPRVDTSPPVPTVFPTPGPAVAADPEWWVYSTATLQPWDTATRVYYFGRRLRTLVVLISLALLLLWAFGELGEGLGAILDLMRGDPGTPTPTTVFLTG